MKFWPKLSTSWHSWNHEIYDSTYILMYNTDINDLMSDIDT